MPSMNHWSDRIAYSIEHDCEMGRVSGWDKQGQEFYIMIEAGKGYRDSRKDAVITIQEAIERGDKPGRIE